MQDSLAATGGLAYAAGLVEAARVLHLDNAQGLLHVLVFPALFMAFIFAAIVWIPAMRTVVSRNLLVSYQTGFGQSVTSVLVGLGVVLAAGAFLFWRVEIAAHGGRDPGAAFSGFAAGIGLLVAQCFLVRRLGREQG